MLLALDRKFVFIAAGKTGTSSISAALLQYLTLDPAHLPFSVELTMPKQPQLEELVNDAPGSTSTIQALAMLRKADDAFQIELTNHDSSFKLRTSDLNDLKHMPVRSACPLLGGKLWKSLFKFAVVRNPWDWVLSNYAYKHRTSRTERMTVEQVLWVRDNVSHRQLPVPYRTQHAFLCDDQGQIGVDHLLQFERLNRDFGELARKLGLSAPLGHLNQTTDHSRAEVARLYTQEAYQLVGEIWAVDVEAFGYSHLA